MGRDVDRLFGVVWFGGVVCRCAGGCGDVDVGMELWCGNVRWCAVEVVCRCAVEAWRCGDEMWSCGGMVWRCGVDL